VNEDQETLSLQAWSTRTLAEFCKAEGKGMHYPISEAGVWVDCVRERKPVIHNDYYTLSHRKGMPAGHAEVMRELVVPTLRNDRIVAILGVGNKPKDYDEKDIEIVSYIADIVWTIVEQKRSNEQIIQLNAKLEQLAMTDELTGLFNRRLFFERGTEEIQRSQRYKTQLSLLMMDIDDFKSVNDTYGHDAGDRMLCCVAKTLQRCKRSVDLLARLGGEEFGILLPNTDEKDAMKLAERLRLEVERATCSNQDHMTGVTMSIGVATRGEEMMSIDDLLKNADAAMYQAKNLGRNKVVSYS
jgi:diguanylate cyclase (GGDEF)-like protein